jgi:hypothetical protein
MGDVKVKNFDQSSIDEEVKENDISMINPCNDDHSRGSPFFDTEGSYIS